MSAFKAKSVSTYGKKTSLRGVKLKKAERKKENQHLNECSCNLKFVCPCLFGDAVSLQPKRVRKDRFMMMFLTGFVYVLTGFNGSYCGSVVARRMVSPFGTGSCPLVLFMCFGDLMFVVEKI